MKLDKIRHLYDNVELFEVVPFPFFSSISQKTGEFRTCLPRVLTTGKLSKNRHNISERCIITNLKKLKFQQSSLTLKKYLVILCIPWIYIIAQLSVFQENKFVVKHDI